jgi:hypothetical protein
VQFFSAPPTAQLFAGKRPNHQGYERSRDGGHNRSELGIGNPTLRVYHLGFVLSGPARIILEKMKSEAALALSS